MTAIKWPGKVYSADSDDLGQPVKDLLLELRVLERPGDKTSFISTPPSLQVMTAGATTVTKGWTSLLALAGGGGALITGLKGIGILPGDKSTEVIPTLVIASAVTLAAVAIAVAIIIRGDVNARATAAAAQYQARARIAEVMLTTIGLAAPSPTPTKVSRYVASIDNDWKVIDRFALEDDEMVAYVGGTRYKPCQLRGIIEVP